jgi:hypothetical protein
VFLSLAALGMTSLTARAVRLVAGFDRAAGIPSASLGAGSRRAGTGRGEDARHSIRMYPEWLSYEGIPMPLRGHVLHEAERIAFYHGMLQKLDVVMSRKICPVVRTTALFAGKG